MLNEDGRHASAAAHATYVPSNAPRTSIEMTHDEVRDAPPSHPGEVLKRMLKLACPDDNRRSRIIFDADAQVAQATGRRVALLKPQDVSPFLNEGLLPDGVEPVVVSQLMPEVRAVFEAADWQSFRQLVTTMPLSLLENKRKMYEHRRKAE